MLKRTLLSALILATLGGYGKLAVADVVVRVAPPPMRSEVVPSPRRGYVWSPGHWEWRRQQHVWVGGNWLRDRPGYRYRSPSWAERDGRWAMQNGGWVRGGRDRNGDGYRDAPRGRDRNGDGYRDAPRGQDRDGNGLRDLPRRRDNDGDGVPNRQDARPNNPNLR